MLIESSGLQGHYNIAGVGTTSSEGMNMTRRKNNPQREHNENITVLQITLLSQTQNGTYC